MTPLCWALLQQLKGVHHKYVCDSQILKTLPSITSTHSRPQLGLQSSSFHISPTYKENQEKFHKGSSMGSCPLERACKLLGTHGHRQAVLAPHALLQHPHRVRNFLVLQCINKTGDAFTPIWMLKARNSIAHNYLHSL